MSEREMISRSHPENEAIRRETVKCQQRENAALRAENEKLHERLASVNDDNQRIRQSVKEYLGNLARVTNDMLREMYAKESGDEH